MTIEEIKQFIIDNKKGIAVGFIAAVVLRAIIR